MLWQENGLHMHVKAQAGSFGRVWRHLRLTTRTGLRAIYMLTTRTGFRRSM